jgi:hypothetical protein
MVRMAQDSLFGRAIAVLFRKPERLPDDDGRLVAELTDMIVDTVEPKVRAHSRYRQELQGCVQTTIAYLRGLARVPLEPVLLARANWSGDPRLNAFFGRAEDIPAFLGRSQELRAFFDDPAHAGVGEALALLAMKREEKTVLGPRVEQGLLREDVARTAVNFTRHRLVAPAATTEEARLEVGRRVMQRLAQVALGRILAIDRLGLLHGQKRSYLATKLRYLRLAQDGMEGIVDDPATIAKQIEAVQRDLDQVDKNHVEAKAALGTLDGYIAQIREVFAHPEQHLALTHTELRLDRMNIKVEPKEDEPHDVLELAQLKVGDRVDAVVVVARCPRAEMPPLENRLAQAERYL